MRKLLSGTVLATLVACLFLPFAGSAAPAHACCRAHGEHHCADARPQGSEPTFTASCPYHVAGAFFHAENAIFCPNPTANAQTSAAICDRDEVDRVAVFSARASGRAPPSYLS